jgi:Asp-tRNA(Asn)/Glu-tRNA(Gln) amidotransferase A subunit family amidase
MPPIPPAPPVPVVGLPVGLQIIGPEGEDPTTIEFARLLAAEIGRFVPRPGYR